MLTDAEIEMAATTWREQGWVLVENLVPTDDIDGAASNLHQLFPTAEERHQGRDRAGATEFPHTAPPRFNFRPGDETEGPAFRAEQFSDITLFPFPGGQCLNRLTIHPEIRRFVSAAIGDADLRLYQSRLWAKYQGAADYEQPFHQDRNHSTVPFRAEPGWWHLEGFLYLSDVDADLAPTDVAGVGQEPGAVEAAAGPRGSFLAYRPDVWHRGVDIERPGGARFVLVVGFRLAGQEWIAFDTVQPRAHSTFFADFAGTCDPEDLALFGVPRPGHDFWTEAMVDALAERYPNLDVDPWRVALCPGDHRAR